MSSTARMSLMATQEQFTPHRDRWARALRALPFFLWIALLPRMIPDLRGEDRGIFVSVAERLRAGDALYRDVWDNKDPLFYYVITLGRWVSPYADVVTEVLWIVGATVAVRTIAVWSGCHSTTALRTSLILTPIVLTGATYVAGYTHTPGITLTLAAMALLATRRPALCGASLGVLTFTKLLMLPVAVSLVAVVLWEERGSRSTRGGQTRGVSFGLLGTSAAVVAILVLRHEWTDYIRTFWLNVSYSGSLSEDGTPPLLSHLHRMTAPAPLLTLLSTSAVLGWGMRARRARSRPGKPDLARRAEHAAVIALVVSLGVLSLTFQWDHHAQLLYVPGLLAAVLAITQLPRRWPEWGSGRVSAILGIAMIIAGFQPSRYVQATFAAPRALGALSTLSPEASALSKIGQNGTYARVGRNDDGGHAFGLSSWTLSCPRFHQYPFDPPAAFDDVVNCLPRTEVILLAPSAQTGTDPRWNDFIRRVQATVHGRYHCHPEGMIRICRRDGERSPRLRDAVTAD